MTPQEKILKQIKSYTKYNNHTGSVRILARYLNEEQYEKRLVKMQVDQEARGYSEQSEISERIDILKALLEIVHTRFGTDVYKKFYMSF